MRSEFTVEFISPTGVPVGEIRKLHFTVGGVVKYLRGVPAQHTTTLSMDQSETTTSRY